jgi:hypothetical protein
MARACPRSSACFFKRWKFRLPTTTHFVHCSPFAANKLPVPRAPPTYQWLPNRDQASYSACQMGPSASNWVSVAHLKIDLAVSRCSEVARRHVHHLEMQPQRGVKVSLQLHQLRQHRLALLGCADHKHLHLRWDRGSGSGVWFQGLGLGFGVGSGTADRKHVPLE